MVNTIFVINSILVLFAFAAVFGAIQLIKHDSAYKAAVNYIRTNPEIKSLVGDDMRFGFLPKVDIENDNGYGVSELKFKVKGKKRSISVRIFMHKEPNRDWVIDRVTY